MVDASEVGGMGDHHHGHPHYHSHSHSAHPAVVIVDEDSSAGQDFGGFERKSEKAIDSRQTMAQLSQKGRRR